jgi:hypothetical protein
MAKLDMEMIVKEKMAHCSRAAADIQKKGFCRDHQALD